MRSNADFCLYVGAYACKGVRRTAHAVLPIGLPPEIDGSYTNLDGTTQVLAAATKLPGDARPGWKVLRALGSALSLDGFGFTEIDEVRAQMSDAAASAVGAPAPRKQPAAGRLERVTTTAVYRADAVLRRSPALQAHPLSRAAAAVLHPEDALALGFGAGAHVKVSGTAVLPVEISTRVPRGAVWIEAGHVASAGLPPYGATLDLVKA